MKSRPGDTRARRSPWLVMVALLAVLSLIAAACGDDDDDTAAEGDDGAAADDGSDDGAAADDGEEPADDGEEPMDDGEEPMDDGEEPMDDGGDAAAGDDGAVEYEEIELQMASFLSPTTSQGVAITRWIEELESRTNGAVTVEVFWDGALLGGTEIRDACVDGRIALCHYTYAYTPADFPLSSIVEVPFLGGNVGAQAVALNQLYANNADFRAEFEEGAGTKVLSFIGIPSPITGANEPVESIDWFDGKTVRASGFYVRALEYVDANPVAIPVNEAYEAMQRGTVEAYGGLILDVIAPLSLHEVGPYIHDAGLGHFAMTTWGMSMDQWNSLSPELQELIEEINAMYPGWLVEADRAATETACNTILDEGGEVSIWSEEATQEWADLIGDDPLNDWLAKAEEAGVADPQAMYDEFVGYYEEANTAGEFAGEPTPMEVCVGIQEGRG